MCGDQIDLVPGLALDWMVLVWVCMVLVWVVVGPGLGLVHLDDVVEDKDD